MALDFEFYAKRLKRVVEPIQEEIWANSGDEIVQSCTDTSVQYMTVQCLRRKQSQ
jgi:hypothetical protein